MADKISQAELKQLEKQSGTKVRRKMGAQSRTRKKGRTSYDNEHDHGLLANGRTTVDNDHDHALLSGGRTSVDMDHSHLYALTEVPEKPAVLPEKPAVPHAAMAASMASHEQEMRRIQNETTAKITEFSRQLMLIASNNDAKEYTFDMVRDDRELLKRVYARPGIHND